MEIFIESLKIVLPAVFGGGAMWVFNLRANIRRSKNAVDEADYNTVSSVIGTAMENMEKLSARVGELERQKVEILKEVGDLKAENERLKTELSQANKALARLIKKDNPTMK